MAQARGDDPDKELTVFRSFQIDFFKLKGLVWFPSNGIACLDVVCPPSGSLNKAILGLDDGVLDTRSQTRIAWKPDVTRLSGGYMFRNPLSYEVKWVM